MSGWLCYECHTFPEVTQTAFLPIPATLPGPCSEHALHGECCSGEARSAVLGGCHAEARGWASNGGNELCGDSVKMPGEKAKEIERVFVCVRVLCCVA